MYDLAIIGLGPAGIEAAQIAIENNLNVVAFERDNFGGTCLNTGCIPTKSIIHCSNLYKTMHSCEKYGIKLFAKPGYEWQTVLDRKTDIVSKFVHSIENNLSKKITIVKGECELCINDTEIQIFSNDNIYLAKNIIVATGSKSVSLKNFPRDGKFILNSDDMYRLKTLPRSIIIVGSGAIGLEWANILSDFGVRVSIVEKAENIAPQTDKDIQKRIERLLDLNNIKFYKNDFIKSIFDNRTELNSGEIIESECILSAIGRVPVLPKFSVFGCSEEFKLKIRDDYETDIENLYIVGDAAGETLLAHSARYQARAVMNKILFNKKIIKKQVPSIIYFNPEIASIGLREQDIPNDGEYRIKRIPTASIAKAWCDDSIEGFVKVIVKDNLIKGAHIISKDASNFISLFNVFIEKNIPLNEIREMIFPHPSYSEAILEVLKGV